MFVCCKIAGFNSFTYIKVKSYINNQWIISDSFWKWSLLVQKTSLNRNYESQAENNESIFYFTKNMNIKQEAMCQQWDLSECLCFSIATIVCFKFWISVLITMNLLFVFNFRLSAFCLLFLKLWLIYHGLGITLSVFIWWHGDWHQIPPVMSWIM